MSDWEDLLDNNEFEPVHNALCGGIKLLEKYYQHPDDTDAYFISYDMFLFLILLQLFNYTL